MYYYYLIAVLVIGVDQWTKWLVVKHMELGEVIPLLEPTLSLYSHRNRGAAWGMLEGQMLLFLLVTIVAVGGIIYFFNKEAKNNRLLAVSLMLLLGGAIGNLIDRMARGEVVDFISVLIPIIQYDFPIFNVADAALTIGVTCVIISVLLEEKKQKEKVS